jgi:SAM-dependent methyltransferase
MNEVQVSMATAKTYTRMRSGITSFVSDAARLYRVRSDFAGDATQTRRQMLRLDSEHRTRVGSPLENKQVLIVGSGQTSREVHALSINNTVTAFDLDVMPQGWNPVPYLALLKQNGPTRLVKTVGRKALGIDRKLRRALDHEFGHPANPARFLQMDASNLTFANDTFDVVYSYSVFEHLPDPASVLREVVRVLRPGGMLYVSTHIYTAEGGCHDLRIFAGDRDGIGYWAQLRPSEKSKVIESCYMNEWSLTQWKTLFSDMCAGVTLTSGLHEGAYGEFLAKELQRLRVEGELAGYTDEELLTVNLQACWTKPVAT